LNVVDWSGATIDQWSLGVLLHVVDWCGQWTGVEQQEISGHLVRKTI